MPTGCYGGRTRVPELRDIRAAQVAKLDPAQTLLSREEHAANVFILLDGPGRALRHPGWPRRDLTPPVRIAVDLLRYGSRRLAGHYSLLGCWRGAGDGDHAPAVGPARSAITMVGRVGVLPAGVPGSKN